MFIYTYALLFLLKDSKRWNFGPCVSCLGPFESSWAQEGFDPKLHHLAVFARLLNAWFCTALIGLTCMHACTAKVWFWYDFFLGLVPCKHAHCFCSTLGSCIGGLYEAHGYCFFELLTHLIGFYPRWPIIGVVMPLSQFLHPLKIPNLKGTPDTFEWKSLAYDLSVIIKKNRYQQGSVCTQISSGPEEE